MANRDDNLENKAAETRGAVQDLNRLLTLASLAKPGTVAFVDREARLLGALKSTGWIEKRVRRIGRRDVDAEDVWQEIIGFNIVPRLRRRELHSLNKTYVDRAVVNQLPKPPVPPLPDGFLVQGPVVLDGVYIEIREVFSLAVKVLTKREIEVFERLYPTLLGKDAATRTQKEIAEDLGLGNTRISQLKDHIREKFEKWFRESGHEDLWNLLDQHDFLCTPKQKRLRIIARAVKSLSESEEALVEGLYPKMLGRKDPPRDRSAIAQEMGINVDEVADAERKVRGKLEKWLRNNGHVDVWKWLVKNDFL